MKVETDFFLAAEKVIVDANNGSVSLIGLIEGIKVSDFPEPLLDFYSILRLRVSDVNEEETVELYAQLLLPNGEIVKPKENKKILPIESLHGKQYVGVITNQSNLVVEEAGSYKFQMIYKEKVIAEVYIDVSKADTANE